MKTEAFEKIIGYEALKQELLQISDVLANGEAYRKLGVGAPRGLLLHGDPGVGKTLMASAVIEASGRRAFTCRKDEPNGDFIKTIKKTFAEAKAAAPSIVLLDDMDKFTNGDDEHPDAEEYVTVQACIDGVKGSEVFVLATANRIRALPNSLLRAGRFDRVIRVENPCGEDARKIVEHYMKQKKFVGDLDAAVVARMMEGRSCAELETVINEAGLYAGFERSEEITMEHFMKACLHTVHDVPNEVLCAAPTETDLSDANDERTQVIYHEAGHAAVREALDPGSVMLVSAYSQEGESGGFTMGNRSDSEHTMAARYAHICCALGGMAALEQKFGINCPGVSRDLDQAFEAVRDLVTENCTSGFSLHCNGYHDSEELRAKQEQAVAAEVERWYRKTKEILSANCELLDAIAAELARKSVLTAVDIRRLKRECKTAPVRL